MSKRTTPVDEDQNATVEEFHQRAAQDYAANADAQADPDRAPFCDCVLGDGHYC
ncbi:hypothetical protein ACFXKG_18405 [Streptomyces sp. NPDC059255]|uniref:hypothetical protein n=1 Tax=unclassified Streptomyces TaxID=2593676 RepID=UPI00362A78BF